MKRTRTVMGLAAAIAVVAVMMLVSKGRTNSESPAVAAKTKGDSTWYHASDVALLAKTGRPQLVEFFHPD